MSTRNIKIKKAYKIGDSVWIYGIEAGFGLWRARYQIILGSLAGLYGLFKSIKALTIHIGNLILGTSLDDDV